MFEEWESVTCLFARFATLIFNVILLLIGYIRLAIKSINSLDFG